jgi:hypothetical protein
MMDINAFLAVARRALPARGLLPIGHGAAEHAACQLALAAAARIAYRQPVVRCFAAPGRGWDGTGPISVAYRKPCRSLRQRSCRVRSSVA